MTTDPYKTRKLVLVCASCKKEFLNIQENQYTYCVDCYAVIKKKQFKKRLRLILWGTAIVTVLILILLAVIKFS